MKNVFSIAVIITLVLLFLKVSAQEEKNNEQISSLKNLYSEFYKNQKENLKIMKEKLSKLEELKSDETKNSEEITDIKTNLKEIIKSSIEDIIELKKRELDLLEKDKDTIIEYYADNILNKNYSPVLFYRDLLGYESDSTEVILGLEKSSILPGKKQDEKKDSEDEGLD